MSDKTKTYLVFAGGAPSEMTFKGQFEDPQTALSCAHKTSGGGSFTVFEAAPKFYRIDMGEDTK